MKLFQVETGKLVIYNEYFGRYLRIKGNDVVCDATDADKATVWSIPELK